MPENSRATQFARISAEASAVAGGVDADLLESFPHELSSAVRAGTRLDSIQRRRYRAAGQRAAARGVALRALLQLYLSAAERLWPLLVQDSETPSPHARDARAHARETEPLDLAQAGQTMLSSLEDVVAALSEGFQLARQRLVREEASARREFVDDLLSGPADVADLVQRAGSFGLDLSGPHAAALVRAERPFSDSVPLTRSIERAVQGSKGDADVLVASKDGALVVVFAAPDQAAVDEVVAQIGRQLRPVDSDSGEGPVELHRRAEVGRWLLGVGRAVAGPTGVRTSYREARSALDTAERLGLPGPVVDAGDMLVYRVLLRDRPAITELIDSLLAPLQQARGGAEPLLVTLRAYFDSGGNAMQTARRLHLSVRAVTYRLERITRLTGQDPTEPSQRFALQAAVLGARLLGWPASSLPKSGSETGSNIAEIDL